ARGAQDAALTVEQYLRGQGDRLGVGALDLGEPRPRVTARQGLVLQRALAALVADRAVERVGDEEEFHHPLLGLVGHRGGLLGAHHHAGRHGGGARGDGLGGALDLDDALAARAHGLEQGVIAEAGDLHAGLLGRADDERALGAGELAAGDRPGAQGLALTRADAGHRATSSLADAAPERAPANTVARQWSNGQPSGTWARYSSRNRRMDETIGAAAASPSAQNDLPTTLSEMSSSSSRSSSVA